MYAGRLGGWERERNVLHSHTHSRASRERHHVSLQLIELVLVNEPTLGTKDFGVWKDVRVMVIHERAAGDYGLERSKPISLMRNQVE